MQFPITIYLGPDRSFEVYDAPGNVHFMTLEEVDLLLSVAHVAFPVPTPKPDVK